MFKRLADGNDPKIYCRDPPHRVATLKFSGVLVNFSGASNCVWKKMHVLCFAVEYSLLAAQTQEQKCCEKVEQPCYLLKIERESTVDNLHNKEEIYEYFNKNLERPCLE
jgi:hypothetical protein